MKLAYYIHVYLGDLLYIIILGHGIMFHLCLKKKKKKLLLNPILAVTDSMRLFWHGYIHMFTVLREHYVSFPHLPSLQHVCIFIFMQINDSCLTRLVYIELPVRRSRKPYRLCLGV